MVRYHEECERELISFKKMAKYFKNWEKPKPDDPKKWYCIHCTKEVKESETYILNEEIMKKRVLEYKRKVRADMRSRFKDLWIRTESKGNTKITPENNEISFSRMIFCPLVRGLVPTIMCVGKQNILGCSFSDGWGFETTSIKCRFFHTKEFKLKQTLSFDVFP